MNHPIKLAYLLPGLKVGGLEKMVISLVSGLDRRKYYPAIVCFDTKGELAGEVEAQGIEVFLAKRRQGIDYFYALRLAKFLKKQNTDLLHAHNCTAFFYGTLAARLARIPIVYTEHDRDFPPERRIAWLNKILSLIVEQVITVSDLLKGCLIKYESFNANKIKTIHNGVDPTPFSLSLDRKKYIDELGLEDASPLIGIVARLDRLKNHKLLLDAMQDIANEIPTVKLLIIGDGPTRKNLEEQADRGGLQNNILFLGMRGDVSNLLLLIDLFVLCSLSEGMPLALIEAMAAGKPIVATNVGGVSEIVRNGINGILVEPTNPAFLAKAILQILKNKDILRTMGENGREVFKQKFTLHKMIKSYEGVYSHAAGRSRKCRLGNELWDF